MYIYIYRDIPLSLSVPLSPSLFLCMYVYILCGMCIHASVKYPYPCRKWTQTNRSAIRSLLCQALLIKLSRTIVLQSSENVYEFLCVIKCSQLASSSLLDFEALRVADLSHSRVWSTAVDSCDLETPQTYAAWVSVVLDDPSSSGEVTK